MAKKIKKVSRDSRTNSTSKKSNKKTENRELSIPVVHVFPESVVPLYADSGAVVRHNRGLFHIFFFSTMEPIILTEDAEERWKQLAEIEKIESRCLARVTVTPEHMREIIDALEVNYKKFKNKTPDLPIKYENE